jgi:hypothetical protein
MKAITLIVFLVSGNCAFASAPSFFNYGQAGAAADAVRGSLTAFQAAVSSGGGAGSETAATAAGVLASTDSLRALLLSQSDYTVCRDGLTGLSQGIQWLTVVFVRSGALALQPGVVAARSRLQATMASLVRTFGVYSCAFLQNGERTPWEPGIGDTEDQALAAAARNLYATNIFPTWPLTIQCGLQAAR